MPHSTLHVSLTFSPTIGSAHFPANSVRQDGGSSAPLQSAAVHAWQRMGHVSVTLNISGASVPHFDGSIPLQADGSVPGQVGVVAIGVAIAVAVVAGVVMADASLTALVTPPALPPMLLVGKPLPPPPLACTAVVVVVVAAAAEAGVAVVVVVDMVVALTHHGSPALP